MDLSGLWSSFCASCCLRCATSTTPEAPPRLPLKRTLVTGLLGITIGYFYRQANPPPPPPAAEPSIGQIKALLQLVTAQVTIADARETNLSGYLGSVRAVLIIKGDALLGPDLSQAKIVACDRAQRNMEIALPQPTVISYRLDHTATRLIYLSDAGLWAMVPGDAGRTAVLNRAYVEAEQTVAREAATLSALNESADRTQKALITFFAAAGWTVQVHWDASR